MTPTIAVISTRNLGILYGICVLLLLTTGENHTSATDPLSFLEETDCSYGVDPLHEIEDERPPCPKYTISTLNSDPHRCMHIASNPVPEDGGTDLCADFDKWSDGTNGCFAYNKEIGWCDKYGMLSNYEGLSAKDACCICGGGLNKRKARYQIGDLVKVPAFSEDCVLKVIGIQETVDTTYTFENIEICYKRNTRGMIAKSYRANFNFAVELDDRKEENIYRVIELRRCRPGTKEQEFWVIPHNNEVMPNERKFTIKHVITGTILRSPTSNLLNFRRVFVNHDEDEEGSKDQNDGHKDVGDNTFYESEQFVYIKDAFNYETEVLMSGDFQHNNFPLAKWQKRQQSHFEQPYSMWSFNKVEESDYDHIDQHSKWLEKKIANGHLSYLKQLAPWHLLDVERDAPKNEVKSRFRGLSRHFHPDKRDGAVFEQIFMLLQEAYDGLKNANEREKETFRRNADVTSQLFPHSQYVVELLPSDWTQIGNDTRAKYVISTNSSNIDVVTEETSFNATDEEDDMDVDSAQVWLLFLYSPRCGMSRQVVSLVELAAKHLNNENVRVGAYGCGLYGQSLEESKAKGFVGWSVDPICKQFQRAETPNTHVVVEVLSGSQNFRERAAKYTNFYSGAARGTTLNLWPRRFIDFAMKGKKGWDGRSLVKYLTSDDFESPSFHNQTRIIVFVNDIEDDANAHEVQNIVLSAVPHVARRLQNTTIHVSIASCATETEDDPSLIDCSTKSVSWLPDVKIYGVNQTLGRSLISEEFIEARDAQIALEAMTNTLSALFELVDDDDNLLDEEEEEQPQECGMEGELFPEPMDTDEEDLLKLDSEEEPLELEDTPEEPKLEDEPEKPKLEAEPEKPKVEGKPEKPKLAEGPAKPKLAQRQNTQRLLNRDKRRSAGGGGGGRVIGGGSHGGGGGAISG